MRPVLNVKRSVMAALFLTAIQFVVKKCCKSKVKNEQSLLSRTKRKLDR